MAILEIQNLTKYYKDVPALSDLSLKVRKGEFVAVIGRSGAGPQEGHRVGGATETSLRPSSCRPIVVN